MNDEEKIKNFGDVVAAVQTLTKPIEEENIRLHAQIDKIHKDRWRERIIYGIAIAVLGIALVAFMLLAYLTPDTTYQYQDFDGQEQVQSSGSEVVTHGD